MQSSATTVNAYLQELPPDRKVALIKIRGLILKNLPQGFEEGMDYGMITYFVPFSRLPKTYNGHPLMYAALASQKNYMSVYLMTIYGNQEREEAFKAKFEKEGKKLAMGKGCVRFKSLDELSLSAVGDAIAACSVDDYVKIYEASHPKKG